MKLLLDENISRRLVPFLQQAYPGSGHVVLLGLESCTDQEIWGYAQANDYTIVTHDADFEELAIVFGSPPPVIWLRTGNQPSTATLKALLDNQILIEETLLGKAQACIELLGQQS